MHSKEITYLKTQQSLAAVRWRMAVRTAATDAKLALNPKRFFAKHGIWKGLAGLAVVGAGVIAFLRIRDNWPEVAKRQPVICERPSKARPPEDSRISGILLGMFGRWLVDAIPLVINGLLYPPRTRREPAIAPFSLNNNHYSV